MSNKFVIRPKHFDLKEDKSVTLSIRIDKILLDKYDELALKSNRSRNELIGMALRYAIENYELIEEEY